jgi:hypothetical protein
MKNESIAGLIQIGSTGRNSGKTTIAKALISKYKKEFTIYGLKIITISGARGACQRGAVGCGICTSIDEGYELIEERNQRGSKDTMQFLQAGCEKVYLLKAFQEHLLAGFQAFLALVPEDVLIVCESNSLREVVEPAYFIMMDNQKGMKKTAAKVIDRADLILETPKLPETFFLQQGIDKLIVGSKDRRVNAWVH